MGVQFPRVPPFNKARNNRSAGALTRTFACGVKVSIGQVEFMKYNQQAYIVLLVVFSASFIAAYLLPFNDVFKAIFASPALLALIAALFQLMRDQATYEKQLEIQAIQQKFSLGATSHMANTAFDKHIEFCEAYMEELQSTFGNLFTKGDTEEALEYAGNLFTIRELFAIWLTRDINGRLEAYEKLIRKLGANAHFISVTKDSSKHQQQRSLHIDSNYELFGKLMGIGPSEKEIDYDRAIEGAKIKVKEILGIEALTKLRAELLQSAADKKT
jgi:hypothetical protein